MLGRIREGIVGLSVPGCIVAHEWQRTPHVRPYTVLGPWIIMPNHLHLVLGIKSETPGTKTEAGPETLQAHSLGAIVGQFKSRCTRRIRRRGFHDFGWQPRFYDRVIRDESELQETTQYIALNPVEWEYDRHHPNNRLQ